MMQATDKSELDTLLQLAVSKRNTELCRLLLDNGADVNAEGSEWFDEDDEDNRSERHEMEDCTDERDTPLHLAVRRGNPELCRLLLERGGNVHARNDWLDTPLHQAVFARSTEVQAEQCTLLIDGGSDLEARNDQGRTPLHEAVVCRDTELCRLLLDRGADMNAESAEREYDYYGFRSCSPFRDDLSKHMSPLHLAVSGRSAELCRLLMERGAQTYARNFWGRTPLQEATRKEYTELFALLRRDAPLHDAVDEENTELCTLLLDGGADVHARNDYGETPLAVASGLVNTELRTLLVARGGGVQQFSDSDTES
eukprot:Rhum_TRINITY_DN15214_c1_g1::Rhum_TRINITY_DN15214_c1_g1_i10::g.144589::m.144589